MGMPMSEAAPLDASASAFGRSLGDTKHPWTFLGLPGFLVRDYTIPPEDELHRSLQVELITVSHKSLAVFTISGYVFRRSRRPCMHPGVLRAGRLCNAQHTVGHMWALHTSSAAMM